MAVSEHDGAYFVAHESVAAGSGSSSVDRIPTVWGGVLRPQVRSVVVLEEKTRASHLLKVAVEAHGENYLVPIVVFRCMTVCLHL